MLHPSHAQHVVREMSELSASPLHDHDFQAVVFVEMNVSCSQYVAVGMVLDLREFVGEIRTMVIVDHRKRRNDILVFIDRLRNETFANEIAQCLRAILVSSFPNEAVELLEKIILQRNSRSSQLCHLVVVLPLVSVAK